MTSKIIPFPSSSRPKLVPPATSTLASAPTVTFRRPFLLPGMDAPHAAGTFEVRSTREPLDVVWEAYRISTTIMLVDGSRTEALVVVAADLDAALALDAAE